MEDTRTQKYSVNIRRKASGAHRYTVYISEVSWPPPSVTTSYIPLYQPVPPSLILPRYPGPLPLAFCPSVSNLHSPPFALLTPSHSRNDSLPPCLLPHRPAVSTTTAFFSSYTFQAIHPTTPLSVLRGFTHTRASRPCATHTEGGRQEGTRQRDHP